MYRPGPGLSLRTVNNLISFLPMESATVTAMRKHVADSGSKLESVKPDEGSWSQTDMLIAAVVDELRSLQYVTIKINSTGNNVGSPPEPIPRPGTVKKHAKISADQARRLDPRLKGSDGDG